MIMGNLPSSALQAMLDALLCTCKQRLQNCKWVFSIAELSQDLKSDLTKAPQTSLLQVRIGEIIESKILHASDGLRLFKSVFSYTDCADSLWPGTPALVQPGRARY